MSMADQIERCYVERARELQELLWEGEDQILDFMFGDDEGDLS